MQFKFKLIKIIIMKKYILLFACVIATSAIFAQNRILDNSDEGLVNQGDEYTAKGMSAMSAFLYLDLKQGTENLAEKYDFVKVNGDWGVTAFAVIPDSKMSLLRNYGVVLKGDKTVRYKSVTIPVANFVAFVEDKVADYVDIGTKCDIQMDSARYYSNADIVQKGGGRGYTLPKGYCGKDVVVGIVDVGFDYTHRNFWDSTETVYRVKRVWDQNNSGTAPSGYGYGNELKTQAAILAALYSHNTETHGSHVAGIAGGGGTNDTTTKKYKGMAPESDLVFVAASGSSSRLYDGITYVLEYADSVGKPCVINLSWGSQVGPHDGYDAVDQNCDYLLDSVYTEGSLIVISAGNDGAKPLHQSKTFSANDTSLKSFIVTTTYGNKVKNYIDFWGQAGHTFAVKVSVMDTASGTVVASTRFGMSNSTTGSTTIANCTITYYIYPSSYLNGKPNITLYINNYSESTATRKVLIEVNATSGTVHEWAYNAYLSSCQRNGVVAGNTNYTINAWGQGDKQIMVASHNTRKYWGGRWYNRSFSGVGARSNFSSIGPSLTAGKIKPDIAAPGCMIISSYNDYASASYNSVYITDSLRNGNHYSVFGAMQGTSMAAPACTGILALWLEAYPQLTADQVKWLLQNYSITDSFTGTIPATGSVYFGRGKIDALAGLQAILQKTAKPTITNSSGSNRICSGSTITLSAPTGYAQYIWNTGDTTRSISVSQIGSYYFRAISAEGFRTPNSDTVRITYGRSVSTNKSLNRLICSGDQVTLSVSGGTSQIWSTGDTSSSITVSPNASTFYTVTSSRSGYCDKTDTISVGVIPLVTATTTGNQTICQGGSVTLNVSGGTSRTWSTGDTAVSITVTPNATTRYTVTSSESGKCSKTDTITVTVQTYVSTAISNDTTVCTGMPATLSVSGGTTRTWSSGDTSASITVTPNATTTYTVTSSQGGYCPTTDTVTVSIMPYISTTITPDTSICTGSSITLSVTGGTSRLWSNGDTAAAITVSPASTTTYSVTSSRSGFCSTTDSVAVTVKRYVTAWVSNDTTVCPGEYVTLTAGGGDSYAWLGIHSGWDTNQTIIYEVRNPWQPILVRIDSTGLCPVWDSLNVFAFPNPYVEIHNQAGQVADHYGVRWEMPGNSATLTATGQTGQTYLWSTGDTTATITVSPTEPTLYSVVSTTEHGCMDSISVTVVCLSTSISTADELGFKLYPNPASISVTIEGANMSEITIYNTLGQVVKNIENNDKDAVVIPVNDFAQGVYVISVKDSLGKTGRRTFVVR